MDETDKFQPMYAFRLRIDYTAPSGLQLRTVRGVDSYFEAERLASIGDQLDERDGAETRYELKVWETQPDRANLVYTLPL